MKKLLQKILPNAGWLQSNINTPDHFPDPQFRKAVEAFMNIEEGHPFTP